MKQLSVGIVVCTNEQKYPKDEKNVLLFIGKKFLTSFYINYKIKFIYLLLCRN